jgi:hypothetical protein
MITRTRKRVWKFSSSFRLKGVDHLLPPGDYPVTTDEELIESLSFPVYRRVATTILVPGQAASSSVEMHTIDPADLLAAHQNDAADRASSEG